MADVGYIHRVGEERPSGGPAGLQSARAVNWTNPRGYHSAGSSWRGRAWDWKIVPSKSRTDMATEAKLTEEREADDLFSKVPDWRQEEQLRDLEPVTFEDVTVGVTRAEWKVLTSEQKNLYREVMVDTYLNLLSLAEAKPGFHSCRLCLLSFCCRRFLGQHVLETFPGLGSDHHFHPGVPVLRQKLQEERDSRESCWSGNSDDEESEVSTPGCKGTGTGVTSKGFSSPLPNQTARPGEGHAAPMEGDQGWTALGTPRFGTSDGDLKLSLTVKPAAHVKEKAFVCSECGQSFYCKSSLIKHQWTHPGERVYMCLECKQAFMEEADLLAHQKTHSLEQKSYGCKCCGRLFTQRASLSRHQRIHSGEKPFKCRDCGRTFAWKSNLDGGKAHLVMYQRTYSADKVYMCLQCERGYTQKTQLIRHQRSHSSGKPYACRTCGQGFSRKSSVIRHQKTHSGERPFQCAQCGRRFTWKSALVKHQSTHSTEKPYACRECGRGFRQKVALLTHQKMHLGEKLYVCMECGRGFTWNSSFRTHQRTHWGEKPFVCLECGRGYTSKSEFQLHQSTHTGEATRLQETCAKFSPEDSSQHKSEDTAGGKALHGP
ncbi:PREDICTED: zinc finger protein 343-like [Elephantulus edwardii]|uniref:zinc finger protein 343-like n=1 Tax=Elephantulus edwardii TaxID=28737 RepID=UPI0003F0D8EF|nr:PREDICTED: zinc finger protein 343-like [Elephantulus edwardii]